MTKQEKIYKLAEYLYMEMANLDYNEEEKFILGNLSNKIYGRRTIILDYNDFVEATYAVKAKYDMCLIITEYNYQIIAFKVVQFAKIDSNGALQEYKLKQEDIPKEWVDGLVEKVALRIIDVIKYTNAKQTTLYWKDIEDDLDIKIPSIVKTIIGEKFNNVNVKTRLGDTYITVYANRSTLVNPNAMVTG